MFHFQDICYCFEINTDDSNHKYIQDKPIIERPIPSRKKKYGPKTQTKLEAMAEKDTIINAAQRKRNANDTFECIEENKSHEENITEEDNSRKTIDEMREKFVSQKEKYEEIINGKENTITSLLDQIKGKENENENLAGTNELCNKHLVDEKKEWKNILEERDNTINLMLKNIENIQNQYNEMKEQYVRTIADQKKISNELQQITNTFFGPIEITTNLTQDEKLTLNDCIEFISLNSTVRSNISARNKGIQMKIKAINRLLATRENAYKTCECKNDAKKNQMKKILFLVVLDIAKLQTTPNGEKRFARTAFKKRIADDQFKIESEKQAIRKLIKNNYKNEYSEILSRMSRYCNSVKLNEESRNIKPLDVSEDIFKVNIITFFERKGLNFDDIEIAAMNDDDTNVYLKYFPS